MMDTLLKRKGMLCDPGDHFVGRYEVERKYAVDDLITIRKRIMAMGAVPFALENHETDLFYDLPAGSPAADGRQQILRHMQPSGRVLWMVKGPGPDECVAMDLADFAKVRQMLEMLGCEETGRIEKQRDIYFLDAFHITLDFLPSLGAFVEIAVMSDDESTLAGWRQEIDALASRLGLPAAALQSRSYRAMLEV